MRSAEHDPKLAELADRAGELGYLAADLAGELSSYAADVDTDPARLAVVSERRSLLTGLVRKYGAEQGTVDEVLEWTKRSADRLAELDGSDERVELLTAELAELDAKLADLGQQMREARIEAAERLGVAGVRGADRSGDAAREAVGRGARDRRPDRSGSTRSSSASRRTRGARRARCRRPRPAVSSPG